MYSSNEQICYYTRNILLYRKSKLRTAAAHYYWYPYYIQNMHMRYMTQMHVNVAWFCVCFQTM